MVLRLLLVCACLFHGSAYALLQSKNTKLLKQWLTGVHQSTNETIHNQQIDLALEVLPIWQERPDGEWLYLESRIIDSNDKPFHQRIVHLVETINGNMRLYNYSIPRASDFAGAYYSPEILSSLTLSQLSLNSSCEFNVKLNKSRNFIAKAEEERCQRGDSDMLFMSTFFTISESYISFLDRDMFDEPVQFKKQQVHP